MGELKHACNSPPPPVDTEESHTSFKEHLVLGGVTRLAPPLLNLCCRLENSLSPRSIVLLRELQSPVYDL